MTGTIRVEEMKFYAYHGYYDYEQQQGNNFIVDIEIEFDIKESALKNDDLHGTLNYEQVCVLIKNEMEIKSKLLENVAYRIKSAIQKKFPEILHLKVSIAKCNPPVNGEVSLVKVVI